MRVEATQNLPDPGYSHLLETKHPQTELGREQAPSLHLACKAGMVAYSTTMTVVQFLHSALAIADVERSRQFYREILGLEELERPFNFPGLWFRVGSTQLHLIVQELGPQDANSQSASLGRDRHLAMGVSDLVSLKHRLEAAGYVTQMSRSGRQAFFVRDPDGNPLEFSQVLPL